MTSVKAPPQPSPHLITLSSASSLLINCNNNNPTEITTLAHPPLWPIKPTPLPHPVTLSPTLTLSTDHNNNNNCTTSYFTICSHPPPWPTLSNNTLLDILFYFKFFTDIYLLYSSTTDSYLIIQTCPLLYPTTSPYHHSLQLLTTTLL